MPVIFSVGPIDRESPLLEQTSTVERGGEERVVKSSDGVYYFAFLLFERSWNRPARPVTDHEE